MLVHFAGSRFEILKHADRLRKIVKIVNDNGHSLVDDWVERAIAQAKNESVKNPEDVDWRDVHAESVASINKADVLIADSTIRSFSVGYQVATAVQMKKPILVLNQEDAGDSYFAGGIEAGVVYKTYTEHDLKSIVEKFLEDNDIKVKDMRFNFFVDRQVYNYLRWATYKTGKTKAEILRELVYREIDKQQGQ